MAKSLKQVKNYRVEVVGANGGRVVIRHTSTVHHACKHACIASEQRFRVQVVFNATESVVFELPPIDAAHAITPKTKRDRRYAKLARKVKGGKK